MPEKKYWFRPAKFWKYFAFYYPVSLEGWIVTGFLLVFLVRLFFLFDFTTHSVIDIVIRFIPWVVLNLLVFDFFCRRFGEYPTWWRKNKTPDKNV